VREIRADARGGRSGTARFRAYRRILHHPIAGFAPAWADHTEHYDSFIDITLRDRFFSRFRACCLKCLGQEASQTNQFPGRDRVFCVGGVFFYQVPWGGECGRLLTWGAGGLGAKDAPNPPGQWILLGFSKGGGFCGRAVHSWGKRRSQGWF